MGKENKEFEINKIYKEPCLETLKKIPDNFLDSVVTSPPYWQLRDYGYDGQWGLEPTYQMYLENLWSMMDEIFRCLKPCGTVWINLGDTYNGNKIGNTSNKGYNENTVISTFKKEKQKEPDKTLLLIPHRFAIGCMERGWIIRNDIVWAKRNGMPESVTDRFYKKHEYFFFMTKSANYFFDLDSIRDKNITQSNIRNKSIESYGNELVLGKGEREWNNEKGKNPGSVSDFWDVPTKPSSEKHYASYNDNLLKKPVIAGCPENGIIYDPFMGTGSTAEVCLRTNRNFIGSEMSSEYCEIAEKRIEKYSNLLF